MQEELKIKEAKDATKAKNSSSNTSTTFRTGASASGPSTKMSEFTVSGASDQSKVKTAISKAKELFNSICACGNPDPKFK